MIKEYCPFVTGTQNIGGREYKQYCDGALRRLYVRYMKEGKAQTIKSDLWICEDCGRIWQDIKRENDILPGKAKESLRELGKSCDIIID